jgi:4-amino-4-deoxy-L-arabinose transferase-like glycosyltransferase
MTAPSDSLVGWTDRRRLVLGSLLVAAICTVLLFATSFQLPMVWDEGSAISRSEGIIRWAKRWPGGGKEPGPLTEEAIRQDWQFTTQVEGHPAFYGIVIAVGRSVSGAWLSPLQAARFGPMLLFGLAVGSMFYRMGRDYSVVAALGAVGTLMVLPRMFAHAHFALYDGMLTACWLLSWSLFATACRHWSWTILWGIILGMTLSTKATGWIAPLAFLFWALLYRDRRALRAIAVGVPIALVAFFLLNPPLWHQPIHGMATFFELNTNRAANPSLNISTWFLGRMYNLDYPLPWYNTLVWTGVTVPVGILLLLGMGLVNVVRHPRLQKAGVLLVGHWVILLVVRALPFAPPHDGVRLFLPSFAFLAALAGLGAGSVWNWAARGGAQRRLGAATGLLALYLGSASSLVWYAPQWLSYYNLAIGGLPGATAAGMEPTYYWDGLDRPVLDWLHAQTPADEKILFGPVVGENTQAGPMENLGWMRRWGFFRRDVDFGAPGEYRWYVLQRRPSGMWPADHWLVQNREPAFRKTIRPGGWGPWRLDVPLVEVYSFREFLEACRVLGGHPSERSNS